MKIDGRTVKPGSHYLDLVTYVPHHAKGNAGHKDCEQGVIIEVRKLDVRVLYCKGRRVQSTNSDTLVWG